VTRFRWWARAARVLAAAGVLALAGCGSSAPSKKGELSEPEKQQLRDLDAQRQQEWGKKK
jgi:hypothetical protein